MSNDLTRSPVRQDLNVEKVKQHDSDVPRSLLRSIFIIVTCTAAMVVNVCLRRNRILQQFFMTACYSL
jgi:hypothetical protein